MALRVTDDQALWIVVVPGPRGSWGPRTRRTFERALRLALDDHVVTVIPAGQRAKLEATLGGAPPGPVLEEPRDLGSGSSVLLALSYVLERDADATVVLLPADPLVRAEPRFLKILSGACDVAGGSPERLIVSALRGTGIVAARAATLWRAIAVREPDLVRRFDTLRQVLRSVFAGLAPRKMEALALEHVYLNQGRTDFALDILQRATKRSGPCN